MTKTVKITLKLAVLFVVISEHTSLFLIPTIIVYLVEFVSDDKSFNTVSFYVGLQEGLFRLVGIFGAMVWSVASDRFGRKKCLAVTMTGIALSSLGQGLSTSLNVLLVWRIFSGFFSATIPVLKALVADIADDSNISVIYSYFASGYGFASIFGPLIAGFCSKPYKTMPFLFNSSFFHRFPYFLPFFIQ
jgi:MFS family permease